MGCVRGVVVLDLETEEIMNCFQRVDICCLNADRCARLRVIRAHYVCEYSVFPVFRPECTDATLKASVGRRIVSMTWRS